MRRQITPLDALHASEAFRSTIRLTVQDELLFWQHSRTCLGLQPSACATLTFTLLGHSRALLIHLPGVCAQLNLDNMLNVLQVLTWLTHLALSMQSPCPGFHLEVRRALESTAVCKLCVPTAGVVLMSYTLQAQHTS